MPTMEPDRDIVSHLHDKMGMKRRVRRREGAESKRVANAIHAIKGARTNDGPDQESPTASPTVTNSASGSPTRYKIEYESGDENDEGILYDNEAMYAPIEEDAVYEDVYIEEIDESGYGDGEPDDSEYEDVEELDEELLEEEVLEDEDEKAVSETEVNDETEFEFDEREEMGPGSISIDETETDAEKAERWAVEEVLEEDYDEIEEEGESADGWNIEEVLEEDAIDEIENEIEEEVIEESPIVETPAEVGAKAAGDTAVDESCDRADVLEAISYILKQEKAVRQEIMTQDQVQDIMNLPLPELLEVLEHFEVSDNSSTPIRWDLVMEKIEAKQGTEDFDAYQYSEDKDGIKIAEGKEDIDKNTHEIEIVESGDEIEIVESGDEVEIFEDDDEVEIFEDDDEVEIFEDDDEVEIFEDDDEVEIAEEDDDEVEIVEEEDEVEIVEAKDESCPKSDGESKEESGLDDSSGKAGQDYSLEAVSTGGMSSMNNDLSEVPEEDEANVDEVVISTGGMSSMNNDLSEVPEEDEANVDEVVISIDSSREPGEVRGDGDETKTDPDHQQIRKNGSREKPRNDFFI